MSKRCIFLAAPISAFVRNTDYLEFRIALLDLIKQLRTKGGLQVFCAAEILTPASEFETPLRAAQRDLAELDRADRFVMIYPMKMPSSILIELGYAIARSKPSLIVASSIDSLPFMARELDQAIVGTFIVQGDVRSAAIREQIFVWAKETAA